MSCKFCENILKSTSIAISGTGSSQVLAITIPTTTLTNLKNYCLITCQSIPSGAGTLPVVIVNGTTTIPVLCRKGNKLRADQIRSRRKYKVVYGNDTSHFLVQSPVCPTSYVATTVSDSE